MVLHRIISAGGSMGATKSSVTSVRFGHRSRFGLGRFSGIRPKTTFGFRVCVCFITETETVDVPVGFGFGLGRFCTKMVNCRPVAPSVWGKTIQTFARNTLYYVLKSAFGIVL